MIARLSLVWLLVFATSLGCSDDEAAGTGDNDTSSDSGTVERDVATVDDTTLDDTGVLDTGSSGDTGAADDTSTSDDTDATDDTQVVEDTATLVDTAVADDTSTSGDTGTTDDTGPSEDTSSTDDTGDSEDTGITRTSLIPAWCPGTPTAPGYYRGTLGSNLNDIGSNSCFGSTPGPDGGVRIELEPGQTVTARYRHAADGILYILDNCPVLDSCLDGSDDSISGEESVSWTNNGDEMNPIYVIMDSTELGGDQTFEFDLFVE